ncbi:MAG: amylo-alpha-1,6-glucosidase [Chloroflexota bacterium]
MSTPETWAHSPETEAVAAEARRVLAHNRQQGISEWDGKPYDFVCPSGTSYPFQWLWDSCFHAIALLHLDPELSKQEIRCLLQAAQPDGFIPHMVLWERSSHEEELSRYAITLAHRFFTATTQPPVLARSVERIYQATGDKDFVREVLPATLNFFRWLRAYRDPDDDGLIAIIQPDESGADASPVFDQAMGIPAQPPELTHPGQKDAMARLFDAYKAFRQQPGRLPALDVFLFEDVMVNAIYGDGLRCLARLSRAVGGPPAEAAELDARARRVTRALEDKCWDDRAGAFWDLSGWDEQPVRMLTHSSLFPLALEDLDAHMARRLIEEHLLNEREFWLPYPVPSVAASDPTFDPDYLTHAIWRGPTWVCVNWYLYWGLRSHGRPDVAAELARRTVAMMAVGGNREFFQPYTAQGQGAHDFGWSCLVLDLIAAERNRAS